LVLSHSSFNAKRGCVFACPISNTARQNPFYIQILEGLAVTGVIMTDQIRSVDYVARKAELIAECPEELLAKALQRVKRILF